MIVKEDKSNLISEIGLKIKEARLNKELTQGELAALINRDKSNVHRVESGKVNPTITHVIEICVALELDLNQLLGDIPFKDFCNY